MNFLAIYCVENINVLGIFNKKGRGMGLKGGLVLRMGALSFGFRDVKQLKPTQMPGLSGIKPIAVLLLNSSQSLPLLLNDRQLYRSARQLRDCSLVIHCTSAGGVRRVVIYSCFAFAACVLDFQALPPASNVCFGTAFCCLRCFTSPTSVQFFKR